MTRGATRISTVVVAVVMFSLSLTSLLPRWGGADRQTTHLMEHAECRDSGPAAPPRIFSHVFFDEELKLPEGPLEFKMLENAEHSGENFVCPCRGSSTWCPDQRSFSFTRVEMALELQRVHVPYSLGILMPMATCVSNMWHGIVEFLIPVVETICARREWKPKCDRLADGSEVSRAADGPVFDNGSILLLLTVPRLNFWGANNKGCPTMNRYPFGLFNNDGPVSPIYSLFFHQSSFKFLPSLPSSSSPHGLRSAPPVVLAQLQLGVSRECSKHPRHSGPPFFRSSSDEGRGNSCSSAQALVQRVLVSKLGNKPNNLRHEQQRQPQPCRTALFVLRHNYRNGRQIANVEEVLLAVSGELQNRTSDNANVSCWTLKTAFFEDIPIVEQAQMVREADILLAARGAATSYVLLLRQNASFISLYPVHSGEKVSVAHDNYPWWPFPYLTDDLSVRFVPCTAITATSHFKTRRQYVNCVNRSSNYCDMVCRPGVVVEAVRSVLSGGERIQWPPLDAEDGEHYTFA